MLKSEGGMKMASSTTVPRAGKGPKFSQAKKNSGCPFGAGFRTKHKATYASLIALAIESSPKKKLMLTDIYAFVEAHRSLVPTASHPNWRNSVRHNLSLRPCFRKVPRWASDGKKLSALWELDHSSLPPAAATVIAQVKKAREAFPVFSYNSVMCSESDEDDPINNKLRDKPESFARDASRVQCPVKQPGRAFLTPEASDGEATPPAVPTYNGTGSSLDQMQYYMNVGNTSHTTHQNPTVMVCPYPGMMYMQPLNPIGPSYGHCPLPRNHSNVTQINTAHSSHRDTTIAYNPGSPPRSPQAHPTAVLSNKSRKSRIPETGVKLRAARVSDISEITDDDDDDDDDDDRDLSSPVAKRACKYTNCIQSVGASTPSGGISLLAAAAFSQM